MVEERDKMEELDALIEEFANNDYKSLKTTSYILYAMGVIISIIIAIFNFKISIISLSTFLIIGGIFHISSRIAKRELKKPKNKKDRFKDNVERKSNKKMKLLTNKLGKVNKKVKIISCISTILICVIIVSIIYYGNRNNIKIPISLKLKSEYSQKINDKEIEDELAKYIKSISKEYNKKYKTDEYIDLAVVDNQILEDYIEGDYTEGKATVLLVKMEVLLSLADYNSTDVISKQMTKEKIENIIDKYFE